MKFLSIMQMVNCTSNRFPPIFLRPSRPHKTLNQPVSTAKFLSPAVDHIKISPVLNVIFPHQTSKGSWIIINTFTSVQKVLFRPAPSRPLPERTSQLLNHRKDGDESVINILNSVQQHSPPPPSPATYGLYACENVHNYGWPHWWPWGAATRNNATFDRVRIHIKSWKRLSLNIPHNPLLPPIWPSTSFADITCIS